MLLVVGCASAWLICYSWFCDMLLVVVCCLGFTIVCFVLYAFVSCWWFGCLVSVDCLLACLVLDLFGLIVAICLLLFCVVDGVLACFLVGLYVCC